MSRGPSTFRQQDAIRALRAAAAAGLDVERLEISKDGKIVVIAGKPKGPAGEGGSGNEWDSV